MSRFGITARTPGLLQVRVSQRNTIQLCGISVNEAQRTTRCLSSRSAIESGQLYFQPQNQSWYEIVFHLPRSVHDLNTEDLRAAVECIRPPSSSSLKITDRSFRYRMLHLVSGIRSLFLFVNFILVPVLPFPTHLFLHPSLLLLLIHHSVHL